MFTTILKHHPLPAFFLLAYAFSWLLGAPAAFLPGWPGLLTFLSVLGPAAAALAVAGATQGKIGVEQLLAGLFKWRVGLHWYLAALLGPALSMLAALALYRLTGKGSGLPASLDILPMLRSHLLALLGIFLYQFVIMWGEELGWRGYALPRLQARYHPILASVILGVLWGLWHLPSFWIAGSLHQRMSVPFFVLASVGYSLLYTWMYNGARGSLLLICLLHAANNTTVTYTLLFFPPLLDEPLFSLAALVLFNLLVIAFAGPKLLWRRDASNV